MSSKLKNLSDYKIPCIPDDALKSIKIGIVISEWNSNITEALAKGCIETLTKHKIKKENIIS
ncbi:MAG TPA: 6,7-dimethyl-8-ribityllumazine synthase, partial [Bacteroidales bacterium]|nr:6,7-dimethyl-8-ribityllumazine synthase [Bacteroidales bacterium]